MSSDYASGLSPYDHKGKLGVLEVMEADELWQEKVHKLADLIKNSKHFVVHTGAGISTAAGIPDFRGPHGIWTLEAKGEKPSNGIRFDDSFPTKTHLILVEMEKAGYIKYLISQNVDGLHLKSGFPRSKLSELHGNVYIEQCDQCHRQFVRQNSVPTVAEKCLDTPCPLPKSNGRSCRGKLHDNVLDWEAELPYDDLESAEYHSKLADLNLCLGSTLQIVPSGKLPVASKSNGGKLVICNLQPTKYDKMAEFLIHTFVDDMMVYLAKLLEIEVPEYLRENDPTTMTDKLYEWTLKNWQPSIKQEKEDKKVKSSKKKLRDL